MADLNAIADSLSSLTIMEAADLAKLLEEKWGVSAAAPVAVPSEALDGSRTSTSAISDGAGTTTTVSAWPASRSMVMYPLILLSVRLNGRYSI